MTKKMKLGALAFVALLTLESGVLAHGSTATVGAINPFACAPGFFSAPVYTGHIDAMHPEGIVKGK